MDTGPEYIHNLLVKEESILVKDYEYIVKINPNPRTVECGKALSVIQDRLYIIEYLLNINKLIEFKQPQNEE